MEEIESGNHALEPLEEDVMVVKLEIKGKKKCLIVIVCYMTVEGEHARVENEIKYNSLKKLVEKFGDEEVLIMGDMNGHIGILNERVNANGERLLKFMDEADVENLNVTMADGKVTWRARENESAIDFVLANEGARRNIRKMVIDEEGEWDVNTDHNVLWVEFCFGKSVEKEKVESGKKRCRWRLNNADWEEFQGELDEMQWSEVRDVKEMNERLIENVRLAAERKIGVKRVVSRKRDNKPWWNVDISGARKERKRLNKVCRRLRALRIRGEEVSDEVYSNAWNEYQVKRKEVKSMIRKAVERHEKNVIEELREKGEEGQKEWYKFMRGDHRVKVTEVKELKVNDGIVSGVEEIKNAISEHWKRVGGMNEEQQNEMPLFEMEQKRLDEMDGEPDEEEIRKVCKMLKNGKAAGNDKIPYEMYKFGGRTMLEKLKELYVEIWRNEKVPESWNETRVTLLHKGGCKSKKELKNYRPIAVADTVGKIFCMVLNGRLKVNVEKSGVYGENQNGFRASRRGEDNMFVICEMVERVKKEGKRVYMAFLDIEKAYDRVDRSILWKVLERCGMSKKVINIIRSMYVNTRGALGEILNG